MNGNELYGIVKDVPREAWPEEPFRFEPNASNGKPSPGWEIGGFAFPHRIHPDHACLMFEASMIRYLAYRGEYPTPTIVVDGTWLTISSRQKAFIAKTLVEALADACKVVQP